MSHPYELVRVNCPREHCSFVLCGGCTRAVLCGGSVQGMVTDTGRPWSTNSSQFEPSSIAFRASGDRVSSLRRSRFSRRWLLTLLPELMQPILVMIRRRLFEGTWRRIVQGAEGGRAGSHRYAASGRAYKDGRHTTQIYRCIAVPSPHRKSRRLKLPATSGCQ